ncbi:hypothetical protein EIL87_24405 [Saccharopolyspora rhizosphaerae]|uniref:Uncharacterized protein n=1 Tax=Saccharopolyspora rhizosphaerae TaxID=2492662 RepID=A0A3R8NTK7_9PSEU|nr:hypothetical protein [Saccharopolyspora rhizosphaerae]RRO12828.1 hypothetical protein EIL87_24405 [Saccharopolyspora rhizosphaerae]
MSGDGWALYSWSQVVDWSTRQLGYAEVVASYESEIAAADHIVRARNMLHDDAEREERCRLLSA